MIEPALQVTHASVHIDRCCVLRAASEHELPEDHHVRAGAERRDYARATTGTERRARRRARAAAGADDAGGGRARGALAGG